MNLFLQTDIPTDNGMYVVYVEHAVNHPFTERRLMMFYKGRWCYLGSDQTFRGEVFGWIGPLPVVRIEDFEEKKEVVYAISTKARAAEGSYSDGPFILLNQVFEHAGNPGKFIFELEMKKEPKPIARWSPKGWRRLLRRKNV